MRRIDTIVLHHSAGEGNAASIRADHLRRGWSDIFYHFVIERDGSLFTGRELRRTGNRSRPTAVEICVVGRLHQRRIFPVQEEALRTLIAHLRRRFPEITNTRFFNHRDFDATICPGNINIRNYIT